MSALFDAGQNDKHVHPWLTDLVFAFDGFLRQRQQVVEFTANPACVFRLQLGRAERRFELADRTQVRPGDLLINLHLWNEQIPRVPQAGPTIGWAQRFRRQLELSFGELARYCASHPDLRDVTAIGANLTQGTRQQRDQLTSIMRRFGFEPPTGGEPIPSNTRLHRLGENVLISVMVLVRNPVVLRANSLWRDRTELFLSRAALISRFDKDSRCAERAFPPQSDGLRR